MTTATEPRRPDAWRRALLLPGVSVSAVIRAKNGPAPEEALTQLFDWERDRLLGLAKGLGAAAVTTLIALAGVALDSSKGLNGAVAIVVVTLSMTFLARGRRHPRWLAAAQRELRLGQVILFSGPPS